MKTYYVIRVGFNAANQSAMGRPANPKNNFESGYYMFLGAVEADSEEKAIAIVNADCYNNQYIFAVTNSTAYKGLKQAIRDRNESGIAEAFVTMTSPGLPRKKSDTRKLKKVEDEENTFKD